MTHPATARSSSDLPVSSQHPPNKLKSAGKGKSIATTCGKEELEISLGGEQGFAKVRAFSSLLSHQSWDQTLFLPSFLPILKEIKHESCKWLVMGIPKSGYQGLGLEFSSS